VYRSWFNKIKYFQSFLPFWLFLMLFKFAGDTHFTAMSPFGERVFPVWLVGIFIGLASFLQLILDVPAGFILDKYGYRKFLKVAVLLFILADSFLFLGLDKNTYLLTLFFGSLGWLFYGPGVNAYILSHTPKEHSGIFISFRDTFDAIGVVLGTILFSMVIDVPVQVIAAIILVILIATFISICLSPKDIVSVHVEKKTPTQNFYIKRHFLNKIIKIICKLDPASWILLLTTLSSSIFYAIIWFVIPLVIAHNEGSGIMNWCLGIFDLTVILIGFWLGKLVDKMNKRILVFLGLLVFSVAGMFLGFDFGILFVLLGFLATVGDEISSLALWSWLYVLDKEHSEDGVISGVINFFSDLGWAIGPILAGFLYSGIGPELTIAVGGLFILIVWIIYTIKIRELRPKFSLSLDPIPKKPHKSRSNR